jgi:hypothetical protein
MCGANIQAFTLYINFCMQNVTSVGISYELQRKESVGEGGISPPTVTVLKGFYICVLFTHRKSALKTKMAAWCCRSLGLGFES